MYKYNLTTISELIHFNLEHKDWIYTHGAQKSLEAMQVEGVYGLIQRLKKHDVALLADEVGMGKTIQALGVMSLLWKTKPNAKVLVLAPNVVICDQWCNEFENLRNKHANEHLAKAIKHIHPIRCKNFIDPEHGVLKVINEIQNDRYQQALFCLTTIHSLSGLVPEDKKDNSIAVAQKKAQEINERIKSVMKEGFDLVVIDEAHYFRNVGGGSQRVAAAKALFGEPNGNTRLAKQYLLLTATPSHSSIHDVNNILGFFKDTQALSPSDSLKLYAVRRLRFMQGFEGAYNKYHYRNEHVLQADFKENPSSELFFALYQKALVDEYGGTGGGKSFLYGYLEGFESVGHHSKDQEDGSKESFYTALDTDILYQLSKEFFEQFNQAPEHPKYGVIQNTCSPEDLFHKDHQIENDKNLIFVRRIPSVREITQRINAEYDEIFAKQIIDALAPVDKTNLFMQWKNKKWSRDFFEKKISSKNSSEDSFEEINENESLDDESPIKSHILDLFIIKKNDKSKTTDCSNFRNRLVVPSSLFSILLEPSSDYKTGEYEYFYSYGDSQKKDDYLSAIKDYRYNSITHSEHQSNFKSSLKTLWADLYTQLENDDVALYETYNGWSDVVKENFSQYFKTGILYASPVIVELYCWFSKFILAKKYNNRNVQQSYRNFLIWVRNKKLLKISLLYKYFAAAISTFEALCAKIAGFSFSEKLPHDAWKDFKQLHNPAWYASGEVQNRKRLIIGFNSPFFPNVLSATQIFQEGVNLHLQCNKVLHYGMAWTPGANEQRIGRIDRLFGKVHRDLREIGQKSELHIYYPYLKNTFDQEQLASFIVKKQSFEDQLDRGEQVDFDKSIPLTLTKDWLKYLRKPKPFNDCGNRDPYPAI